MTKLIALTGKMGSGKSTVIDIINTYAENALTFVRLPKLIKFAGPLYRMQTEIYDIINKPVPKPKDRKLLQWLGTEWGRDIDENLWVNLFKDAAEEALSIAYIVVNDDCRFDNEAEVVRGMGGKIVEVVATDAVRGERIELLNTSHPSESGINPNFIDYRLSNNGSLADLESQVQGMLKEFGL